MKIKLNKAIVEFIPENEVETAELEALQKEQEQQYLLWESLAD